MNADFMRKLPADPGRRIHVLEVVGNAIIGGMEKYVERLVEHLPPARFRITVLCPFEGPFVERLRDLGAEILIVPMPDEVSWTSLQMCCALVASRGIDVLHAHLSNAHLLAGLVGRLGGKPVLTTIHGRQVTMLDLEVHRVVGSHLSVVCQQSYFHALGLGVELGLLSCEPNGVDTEVFCPGPRGKDGIRVRLGVASTTPLIGFVGRLSHEKGPDVFLRAAIRTLDQLPDARFVIVGEGPMASMLGELIDKRGLGDRIHPIGACADMPPVFRELDLLVCSSHSEAMPLAVMEAMATGVPVIATRVGGVPDFVEHGRSGWLTAPRDSDEIAMRIAQTIETPGLLKHMGAEARARAVDQLELQLSVNRVAALLERLVMPAVVQDVSLRHGLAAEAPGARPRPAGSAKLPL